MPDQKFTDPKRGGPIKLRDQGDGTFAEQIAAADAPTAGCGDVQVSISSAVTLAAAAGGSIPAGARGVYIQPENGDLRFRRDGVNPTGSVGMLIRQDVAFPIVGDLGNVRLIATSGTVLTNLQFFG